MLVISSGREFVDAVKGGGLSVFLSLTIVIPFTILGSWLLARGMSNNTAKFGTWSHIKYLLGCIVLSVITIFFTFVSYVAPKNIVNINGLDIPLGKCLDANIGVISNDGEREEYCKCVAEKILIYPDSTRKYEKLLVNNRFDDVIIGLQKEELLPYLGIENCLDDMSVTWNKSIELEFKKQVRKGLEGTELEKTNHIDKYCDCLMIDLRKQPANEVFDGSFLETDEYQQILDKCDSLTSK